MRGTDKRSLHLIDTFLTKPSCGSNFYPRISLMARSQTTRAIERLVDSEPTYEELIELYNDLRESSPDRDAETVSQLAIAQVLSECLTYLDYVEAELEKSIGISRSAERERILDTFQKPLGQGQIERAASIVRQWENFEKYTQEEVEATIVQ